MGTFRGAVVFGVAVAAAAATVAPPTRTKVQLPGLESTEPYSYYAGYLDAGVPPSGRGNMYFHYICAMAPDWQRKPLTIWYNGGPGAPSVPGLFVELGPFRLTSESYGTAEYSSTGLPTPLPNLWTWANVTSLCEIDSPAPVGASYCTEGNGSAGSRGGPSGDPYTCGPWTDTTTAAANHKAHIAFFNEAFPEYEESQQPVYIAGESYAGMYVPLFVNEWLDDPVKGPGGKTINFGGFAVGDGWPGCIPMEGKPVDWCVDFGNGGFFKYPNALPGPHWDVEFFHGHSQMSEDLYFEIQRGCTDGELRGKTAPAPLSDRCEGLMQRMSQEVGFFFAYDLYDACEGDVPPSDLQRRMLAGNARRQATLSATRPSPTPGDGDSGIGASCLGNAMADYFGDNRTKAAFGIPADNNFIFLDNAIGMNYTNDAAFVGYVYEKAIKAGKRVLIYEGDTDACGLQTAPIEDIWVPFLGNGTRDPDQWTPMGPLNAKTARPLGLTRTQGWQPFGLYPGGRRVQGGYSMAWLGGQVRFVSIRGAGHLAPFYRPAASYTMFRAFASGEALPAPFYPHPASPPVKEASRPQQPDDVVGIVV